MRRRRRGRRTIQPERPVFFVSLCALIAMPCGFLLTYYGTYLERYDWDAATFTASTILVGSALVDAYLSTRGWRGWWLK